LFDYFVTQSALRMNRPAPAITPEVIRDLMAYHWPGNVRELRNQADRFVLDLKMVPGNAMADTQLTLHAAVESFEKGMIAEELRKQGGNVQNRRSAENRQNHAVRQDPQIRSGRKVSGNCLISKAGSRAARCPLPVFLLVARRPAHVLPLLLA
jgi:DNA-binding NtrC family response regulator